MYIFAYTSPHLRRKLWHEFSEKKIKGGKKGKGKTKKNSKRKSNIGIVGKK